MASVECLACGHRNDAADASCAACASSLDLKLCAICEAINANAAARCHACGLEFYPGARAPARSRFASALWAIPLLAAAVLSYYFSN